LEAYLDELKKEVQAFEQHLADLLNHLNDYFHFFLPKFITH